MARPTPNLNQRSPTGTTTSAGATGSRPWFFASRPGGASHTTRSSVSQGILSTLFSSSGSGWAASDVRAYLNHYPGQSQNMKAKKNIDFYLNRIPSSPSPSGKIDFIHEHWFGDYSLLESHHGYIQWLFPIREDGLNSQAQMLYKHEIEILKADPLAQQRLLKSYHLMLDFYGMKLLDAKTGEIGRNPTNYEDRYRHLNRSTHNYLRITRILKCLGELGFEHLKLGFLLNIVRELTTGALSANSVGKSARDYWFPILRSQEDCATLQGFIKQVKEEESQALLNGQGQLEISPERIHAVLKEVQQRREAAAAAKSQNGSPLEEKTNLQNGSSSATSSSTAATSDAYDPDATQSLPDESDAAYDEGEDWSTDSPRAAAEALSDDMDEGEDVDEEAVARSTPTSTTAASLQSTHLQSPTNIAAAAITLPSSSNHRSPSSLASLTVPASATSATKRKRDSFDGAKPASTSTDEEDAPVSKKPTTPKEEENKKGAE